MALQSIPDPDEYRLTEADILRFADEQRRGMASPQDPQLNNRAQTVPPEKITAPQFQELVARMYAIAADQRRKGDGRKKRRTLVGLAAPQIGEPWRIILIDTKVGMDRRHYGKLECFINPVVVWRSRETVEEREGCFSTGPVWGLVRRPLALKIRGLGADGVLREKILEGFSARIAAHEIDHLDGIRFPERITSDRKRHWVHTEELLDYPDRTKQWPRHCTLERWLEFKRQKPAQ
ncbi:MAG TPA: peptide deformylase [Candidatus Saccharimonadales bacterium]|nr:peptide deformylase [Candidatus Saccharimonadales bacterium]